MRFDKNRYSVDARAVGRPVEIRTYADRLECWQDGQVVGRHERAFGRGKTIYDPLHYIPVLGGKPGALGNGARSRTGISEALEQGVHSAGVVLNILARRRDPPPPLTINATSC